MTDLARLVVRLEAESSQLRKELERTNGQLERWEARAGKSLDGFKKRFSATFATLGGAVAVGAISSGLRAMVDEAQTSERQLAKLNALVRATGGAAGLTARDLDEFSRALARSTLASTQGVREAAGVLLTFKTISGDTFKRTLTLAQDLAATLGSDLKGATLQLGKALENPIQGLSALTEAGVTFTQAEQSLIKGLVASGKQLQAQEKILDKVAEQVGGAGAGEAAGLAGKVDFLGQAWQEFLERVGNAGPLQAAGGVVDWLTERVTRLERALRRATDPQEEFFSLADRRAELLGRLARNQGGTGQARRQGADMRRELAEIEARMRQLQDENIARQKEADALGRQAGVERLALASQLGAVEQQVTNQLKQQAKTFSDLLAQAKGAISAPSGNALTDGTLTEALRALDQANTLAAAGDQQGALAQATRAVEVVQKLREADAISKDYARTLLEQAGALGERAVETLVALQFDDQALAAEAERARSLIQANFSATPFTAAIEWVTPQPPATPTRPGNEGENAARGAPLILNFGGREYETTIPVEDADRLGAAMRREALRSGGRC